MDATNELTEDQFRATFAPPMIAVEEGDEVPSIDLSCYVATCIRRYDLPTTNEDIQIHHVYRTGDGHLTHILFWYGEPNVYLVVVIRNAEPSILGHHFLNLNDKYGLTT